MNRFAVLALVAGVAACGAYSDAASTDESAETTASAVQPFKELMIVHPSVVHDPLRTSNVADGHWSFRWLMERLSSKSGLAPNEYVEAWLSGFHTTTIDGTSQTLRDRPGVDDLLARWPKGEDGHIDLA